MSRLLISLKRHILDGAHHLRQRLLQWTRPTTPSLLAGTLADLARTKVELPAENALLRQHLIILRRQVKRPTCTKTDRMLLMLRARADRRWKQALFLVQPDTLLGWHRQVFRWYWRQRSEPISWYWRQRSEPISRKPKLAAETVTFIKSIARDNRLWGAERIRGELLKLGIRVSKRTIQKYMRQDRAHPSSQTWSTFLHNHAHEIWACDFLQVTDLFFHSLFAFFIIELQSRKVIHEQVLSALVAEGQRNPDFVHLFWSLQAPVRQLAFILFEREVARGDLPSTLDRALALDLLLGPITFRQFVSGATLDPTLAPAIVDAVLYGIAQQRK